MLKLKLVLISILIGIINGLVFSFINPWIGPLSAIATLLVLGFFNGIPKD